ncbi:hypothetical protein ARTHRO9AX_220075 [Arthrobacter sp. 9AX]|nr:hypothetical protein ARTHRO9AX_220075 [Arthrobacter sp. 9AX]
MLPLAALQVPKNSPERRPRGESSLARRPRRQVGVWPNYTHIAVARLSGIQHASVPLTNARAGPISARCCSA